MIKRLDPNADAAAAKPPKQIDGLQFDSSDDDDSFFQGTGQSVTIQDFLSMVYPMN